jgi:hypothetical protein
MISVKFFVIKRYRGSFPSRYIEKSIEFLFVFPFLRCLKLDNIVLLRIFSLIDVLNSKTYNFLEDSMCAETESIINIRYDS